VHSALSHHEHLILKDDNVQLVRLGNDLFEGNERLSGLHASCAAPQPGLFVETEEALLQTLVFEGSQCADRCNRVRSIDTGGQSYTNSAEDVIKNIEKLRWCPYP
jgi:hypothetical protein